MRFPRKLAKDAIYHVTARANLQEYILKSKKIKDLFMTVIEMANMKFNFELINFSVMDNHVHLLIKPIGNPKNLSKIMQWILSVFAIRFNKKFKKKGHVWYDRFHSSIIKSAEHLKTVFDYISQNPVKAKIAKTIFSYKYSGIYHLMQGNYHLVKKPSELLMHFFPYLRI